jgi:hypothetical protein
VEHENLVHVTNLELSIQIDYGDFFLCSHEPLMFEVSFNKRLKIFCATDNVIIWVYGLLLENLVSEADDEIQYGWNYYIEEANRGQRELAGREIMVRELFLKMFYKRTKE